MAPALKGAGILLLLGALVFFGARFFAGGEEGSVVDAIERVATTDDPSYCAEGVTQAYLEQVSGLPGEAAYGACVATASEPALTADAVEVSDIRIDGDDATAIVSYEGSTYDGSTLEVGLVRERGGWRLDSRLGFETLDRDRLGAALRATLAAPPTSLSPAGARCAAGRLTELGDAALESALLASDPSTYTEAVVACDRDAYLETIASGLDSAGYPESLGTCVRSELGELGDPALVAVLGNPVAYTRVALDCDRDAFIGVQRQIVVAEGAGEEEADCVASKLDELGDQEIARTSIDGEVLERIYAECGIGN